jgi:hypothetical protein
MLIVVVPSVFYSQRRKLKTKKKFYKTGKNVRVAEKDEIFFILFSAVKSYEVGFFLGGGEGEYIGRARKGLRGAKADGAGAGPRGPSQTEQGRRQKFYFFNLMSSLI